MIITESTIFSVYSLIDPRTGLQFYIGMSCNPKKRLLEHACDPASSAYQIAKELKLLGLRCQMQIISTHSDREEAFDAEYNAIFYSKEKLVNRFIGKYPIKNNKAA